MGGINSFGVLQAFAALDYLPLPADKLRNSMGINSVGDAVGLPSRWSGRIALNEAGGEGAPRARGAWG